VQDHILWQTLLGLGREPSSVRNTASGGGRSEKANDSVVGKGQRNKCTDSQKNQNHKRKEKKATERLTGGGEKTGTFHP